MHPGNTKYVREQGADAQAHISNSFFLLSFMARSMMVLIGSYTNCTKPRLHVAVPVAFLVHFLVDGSQKLSPHNFSIILAVCKALLVVSRFCSRLHLARVVAHMFPSIDWAQSHPKNKLRPHILPENKMRSWLLQHLIACIPP